MPPDWRNLIAYSHWVLLTDRCVVIGCLLIELMMLIDTYHSMIVRFTSPTTRHFLSLLSLQGKKTSGTRVNLVWLFTVVLPFNYPASRTSLLSPLFSSLLREERKEILLAGYPSIGKSHQSYSKLHPRFWG